MIIGIDRATGDDETGHVTVASVDEQTAHKLLTIADNLATQDNRATANPIFIVQQLIRDWGYSPDYVSDYEWVSTADGEMHTAGEDEARMLEEFCEAGDTEALGDWERAHYRDRWEWVTSCLTGAGCEEYLRRDGHNLRSPRIYVAGGYRNDEWATLRALLGGQ